MTAEEIEAKMTPAGGYTRATLAAWGVPWPPPKGWKDALVARSVSGGAPKLVGKLLDLADYYEPNDLSASTTIRAAANFIAQGIEARQGGDAEGGSVHESPVAEGDAPNPSNLPHTIPRGIKP